MILALLGCDPCAGWAGATVSDPEGLVGGEIVARLQRTVDDFFVASGASDVCVSAVEVADLGPNAPYETCYGCEGITVTLAPRFTVSDDPLREALCEAFVVVRGIEDGSTFIDVCRDGPARFRWSDEIGAACGTTALTSADAEVRAIAWPYAPPSEDGVLTLTEADPVEVTGLAPEGGSLSYAAAAGALLAVEAYRWDGETWDGRVSLIDPVSGAVEHTIPTSDFGSLWGGADRAVLDVYTDDGVDALTSIFPDGTTRTVRTPKSLYDNGQAVQGDAVYVGPLTYDLEKPLLVADLSTGAITEVDVPTPPDGLIPMLGTLDALGDGTLLVSVDAVESETECGGFDCVSTVAVYDQSYVRYDPVDTTWTGLDGDFYFSGAGTLPDGAVFGRFRVEAGAVYAAWDPPTGRFWVNDEVCAGVEDDLGVVLGDRVYALASDETDTALTLTPYVVSRE